MTTNTFGQLPSKSNRKRLVFKIVLTAVAILVIATAVVVGLVVLKGNPASPINENTKYLRTAVDEKKEFDKGASAMFGFFEVTINKVTRNYVPEDGSEPTTSGYKFILLNVTVKNTDGAPHFINDLDLAILHNENLINASFAQIEPALKFGTIEAGTSNTGNVLYAIPPDATDLSLYYNTQIYSNEQEKLRKIEHILPF